MSYWHRESMETTFAEDVIQDEYSENEDEKMMPCERNESSITKHFRVANDCNSAQIS